jgi:hypothetical protein
MVSGGRRSMRGLDGGGMDLTDCYSSSVSRCTFFQNEGSPGGEIGALPVGCGGVPARERSRGAIKSLYAD